MRECSLPALMVPKGVVAEVPFPVPSVIEEDIIRKEGEINLME